MITSRLYDRVCITGDLSAKTDARRLLPTAPVLRGIRILSSAQGRYLIGSVGLCPDDARVAASTHRPQPFQQ